MDPAAPELSAFEVFARVVAENVLDVLADDNRRKISGCPVAIDDRGGGREQADEAILRRNQHFTELLTCGDVVPGADDFDWLSGPVADHLQIVADPAIVAVFLAEPVFVGKMVLFKQPRITLLDTSQVCRMYAAAPEIWALKIFFTFIAEQFLDVLAYERGPIVTGCFKGIDHSRRPSEQILGTNVGRHCSFFCLLAGSDVAPRPDHLNGLSLLVADQLLRIIDRAIVAVAFAKAILDRSVPVCKV